VVELEIVELETEEASAHHICNPVEGAAVMDVVEAQVIEAEAIFVVAEARLA
jgi:hypothetical protein